MKNPIKPLRIGYALKLASISAPAYDRAIPPGVAEPELYVLVSSQTAQDYNNTKCGNGDTECTVLLQVIHKSLKGYIDTAPVDDLIDEILRLINTNAELPVTGFRVLTTELASVSVDEPIEFDTQSMVRGLVRFRHLVSEASV